MFQLFIEMPYFLWAIITAKEHLIALYYSSMVFKSQNILHCSFIVLLI